MVNPVALFHFRLGASHGIGRVQLLSLWSAACQSKEVAVSRAESGSGHGKTHTYSLLGPPKNLNIQEVENRLHDSLVRALPKTRLVLNRY